MMESPLHEQAAQWLARRRAATGADGSPPDPATERAFQRWLQASPEHARAYAEAEALWAQLGGLPQTAPGLLADARRDWQRQPPPRSPRWQNTARRLALAASLAGLAWWIGIAARTPEPLSYQTAVGERRSLRLDDGSSLQLDSASRVVVTQAKGERRLELLEGQALIEVQPVPGQPFVAHLGGAEVHDIGTRFELRQVAGASAVTVLDGLVDVQLAGQPAAIRLGAGQMLRFRNGEPPGQPQAVDPEQAAAWQRDELVVHDLPLRAVLAELARYRPEPIEVTPASLLDRRLSGRFSTRDLPQSLRTLAAVLPARLEASGAGRWRLAGSQPAR